jgi:hypothetical protein
VRHSNIRCRMSVMGHEQPTCDGRAMSAFTPESTELPRKAKPLIRNKASQIRKAWRLSFAQPSTGMIDESAAGGLFLLNELDPELGLVKPNDLACSSGLIFQYNFELRRNAGRGLNLQARAGPGEIPNCARDRMLSEKDLPGFQQTPARWRLPSVQRARQLRRPHAAMVGLS